MATRAHIQHSVHIEHALNDFLIAKSSVSYVIFFMLVI